MRRVVLSLCICVLSTAPIWAQQVKPTPPADAEPVVKIATDLIQIDVTATDKSGKVVTDLTADDFEIYENGQKQPISNFSFSSQITGITNNTATNPGAPGAQPGPGTRLTPGMVNRTIAIIIDDLNMSFASVYYTRRALRTFVDRDMRPEDPKNARVSGAVLLKDLAPGDYVLHVMVRDTHSKKFSTQIFPFEIVK